MRHSLVFKRQDQKCKLKFVLEYDMQAYRSRLLIFLTSALTGNEWSKSLSGHFTWKRKQVSIEWEAG